MHTTDTRIETRTTMPPTRPEATPSGRTAAAPKQPVSAADASHPGGPHPAPWDHGGSSEPPRRRPLVRIQLGRLAKPFPRRPRGASPQRVGRLPIEVAPRRAPRLPRTMDIDRARAHPPACTPTGRIARSATGSRRVRSRRLGARSPCLQDRSQSNGPSDVAASAEGLGIPETPPQSRTARICGTT
jgi:hypothetical protein